METADARTDVAGDEMAGLAACYLARTGANAAPFGRAPRLGGHRATRDIHTSLTNQGSA